MAGGNCTIPCTGSTKETCGGSYHINAYAFSCSGTPTPTPSPPGANFCPDFSRDYCKPDAGTLEQRIALLMGRMTSKDKMATMAEQVRRESKRKRAMGGGG